MSKRPVYQIETSAGVYEVEADNEQQAQKIGNFIQEQVDAGNPELKNVKLPFDARTEEAAEPLPQTTSGGSFVRGANDMGFLNFADEIAAFGNTAIPGMAELDNLFGADQTSYYSAEEGEGFWDVFNRNLRERRGLVDADKVLHPTARTAGQITGAVGTLGVGGPALRGAAGLAARVAPRAVIPAAAMLEASRIAAPVRTAIVEGAAIGAGTGAVAGAGEGNGNRAQSAAGGLLLGGAFGAGAGAVVTGLGPQIARYWNMLRGRGTEQEATRQIIQALARDGYDVSSPTGIQALRQEIASATGKPISLADVGNATRARTGVGLRAPSDAQARALDTVTNRQLGQEARLTSDVRAAIAPRTDVHALDEALVTQRGQDAERLRERALFVDAPAEPPVPGFVVQEAPESLEAGLKRLLGTPEDPTFARVPAPVPDAPPPATQRQSRIVEDPTIQQLARLPDAQRALKEALERSRAEVELRAAQGEPIDHLPDLTPGSDLDVRTLDILKRHLDTEVNTLFKGADTATFKVHQAHQVKALRDAIRDRLKVAVPEYGEYLDTYAGQSELLDSLREGRTFTSLDPEEIAAGQAARTTGEREMYRVGAARNLVDDLARTRGSGYASNRILSTTEQRNQVQALGLPTGNYENLLRSTDLERRLSRLTDEVRGSPTQQRQAAARDADAGADLGVPWNVGNPFVWAGNLARRGLQHVSTQRNRAVNEALLPRMLEQDTQAIDNIIDELQRSGRLAEAEQLRREARNRRVAGFLGIELGTNAALPQGE